MEMRTHFKKPYEVPMCLQTVKLVLESDLLAFGSIVDSFYPIETLGQNNGGFYDHSLEDSPFNHTWAE